MALTLRTKIFVGFGMLIGVSLVSGVVFVREARVVQDRSTFVLEEAVPTMLNAAQLRGAINHALSMHRGYMILGLEEMAEERLQAWDEINTGMQNLRAVSADWPADQRVLVDRLEETLGLFRAAQDRIAVVSHTAQDRPADKLYFGQGIAKSEEVVEALTRILAIEHNLEATPERKLLVERVTAAEAHLLRASAAISAYLASGSDEDRAVVDRTVAECSESVARLTEDAVLFSEDQAAAFEDYLGYRAEFLSIANEALAIRGGDGWCVSQDICLNVVTPLAVEADRLAAEIVEKQTESQTKAGEDAYAQLNGAVAAMAPTAIAGVLVSAVLGGVIGLLLSRSIGCALRQVAERAQLIASKRLDLEPLDVRTKDDLGLLAWSVNDMLGALREIVLEVKGSSDEVAGSSEQIRASASDLMSGMDRQMSEVEQISAAVTELAASVSSVAETSRGAAEAASGSAETAREGGLIVSDVVRRMNEIEDAVRSSSQSVTELGRQSEEIGVVISVINDIADQTNLLALNAAIEAARAGEHGRGFAVVADEVRKLAERTQEATRQVTETISGIQEETKAAVGRMESGTARVAEGVRLTRDAGESLGCIVTSARGVTDQVQSIAASAEQQAAASGDISRGVAEIARVVRDSREDTERSAEAAGELSGKAERLREIVGRFRL